MVAQRRARWNGQCVGLCAPWGPGGRVEGGAHKAHEPEKPR